MGNFCINCGAKLEKDYNFCINCGTKVDKSNPKHDNPSKNTVSHQYEKERAKNEVKRIMGGRIFFNTSFNVKLRSNGLGYETGDLIRKRIEQEIDSGQIESGDVEGRINQLIHEYRIEKEKRIAEEEARIAREKEMRSQKIETNKPSRGGYCSIHCRHYREEFLDSYGGIVGDFDSGGYVEYYCSLGHSISHGSYCKDYE